MARSVIVPPWNHLVNSTPYDNGFYEVQAENSLRSARIVAPILIELIKPSSIVDVGCGLGAWLKAFQENGVPAVRGLDGEWVDGSKLLIDPSAFTAVDLTRPFQICGQFDLAICLEVAEHIPARFAAHLIRALTRAAPVVLFSAAVPGQGGCSHVNEQWPGYWRSLFGLNGFRLLDPIHRQILTDDRVDWYYRQNMFLFASDDALAENGALRRELVPAHQDLEWVNIRIFARHQGLRYTLPRVPLSLWRGSRRLLRKFIGNHGGTMF